MNRFISIIAAAAITASAYAASPIASDISQYVYPNNAPTAPPSRVYMPDGETYLMPDDSHKLILRYLIKNDNLVDTIFNAAKSRETKISSFESFSVSPDGSFLMLSRNKTPIYRRSFKAEYYAYEVRHNILRPLSTDHPQQQSPLFSPDSRVIAFVVDNDIYMKKLDYNSEVRVTNDGKVNSIINGVPDWVYEEEFSTSMSMAWSPDSQVFCFLKYNETDVPTYSFPLYQGTCHPDDQYALYPGLFTYKYPVAGEKNSVVTLHSYDLSTRKTQGIKFEDDKIEYIPRIIYSSDPTKLIVATLNRDQNRMEVYSVNPKSTVAKSLIVEQHKAWLDPSAYEQLTLTDNSIVLHSSRSGFNHLYEYSLNGAFIRQITSGDYDVTDFYGKDAAGNYYYQSTKSGPLNRVISKLDAKGKTTDLSPAEGTSAAVFTPKMDYYLHSFSDSKTPPTYTFCTNSGKVLRTLEDNEAYASRYAGVAQKEFFTFTSDGYELNGYMVKPTDFSASKSYPVIMWQYSGPGSQEVANRWSIDWQVYAAQEDFIVVCVDGRGTGYRGRAFMDMVYRNLGYYETIDQINAAKYVSTLPFVDASRIGICGWSYGGYETLMAISAKNAPFKAAVAIAPVTDWRYYDNSYAERYMLTPKANEDGYRDSAPINRTKDVSCELLLMSGTADDNVHLSNTMEYVSRLQSDGTLCDMLLFPNMNHSIYGCDSRRLVYGKMIDFFKKNM